MGKVLELRDESNERLEFLGDTVIKSVIADKHIQFKNDVNGGVIKVFNNGKSKQNSLSEKQVLALSSIAKSIEEKAGKPQDIEFCIEKGEVFILQTRPITSIKERGEYTVYDNSNIIESYPGITSELTFSFIIKMYEAVYKQLVGLFGVSEKNIQKNSIVFEHTLAHVRGRVFYNLLSWYKMLAMLPGYSINARLIVYLLTFLFHLP